ncbi:MAG: GNAT family N-acetyltransferase [Proteobacteria bacterium]|nr:GNAT family N-acetyltransferase [Pseudomonadota bacterium]
MQWHDRTWQELSRDELYAIIQLREAVFVVEQACAYQDADGHDPSARHLWAADAGGLVAYCRLIPAGVKLPEVSIGRVICARSARGTGLGRRLMQRAIAACGAVPIQIGAQAHLEKFYGDLGFRRISEVYDEDGIPHVDMLRPP